MKDILKIDLRRSRRRLRLALLAGALQVMPVVVAATPATGPSARPTTIREIAETADLSGLVASPDGNWVAYRVERPSTATNRIDVDWYVVAADGRSQPRRLGRLGTAMWNDAGTMVGGEARWSPDSRTLVVRALVDGRVALWSSAVDGSGFHPLVAGEGDIEAFAFAPDGRLITSEGPARDLIMRTEDAERETGILIDGRTDIAQPLFRGALINGRPASQRFSGDWFDREPLLAQVQRTFVAHDISTGAERAANERERALLAPVPHPALLSLADLPASLRTLLEAQNVCADRRGCSADRLRFSTWIARDGGGIVALRDFANRQSLQLWASGANSLTPLASSEGLLSGGRFDFLPCAATPGAIFCVEATAALPPRLVRIALDGTKSIVDAPNRDLAGDGLVTEPMTWEVNGVRASGILIRPESPGRLPLFVNYYRCDGYLRGGTGDEWPLRALAASGIAALCINAVAGGETAQQRYDLAMSVVSAAIDLLARRELVDPSRVGMGGLSFGSEVAMWTATHSNLLRAVSIASISVEPTYYWFNARPGRETFTQSIGYFGLGHPDEDPAGWDRMSASRNVERITAPILMQMPENEARQSIELQSRLATARMGEMHVFPFAPHIKVEPRQKLAAYQRNLDWFRYWLQGYQDPDPAKADQYRRWQTLGVRRAGDTAP